MLAKTSHKPSSLSLLTIQVVTNAAREMARDFGWPEDKTLARVWSGVELAESGTVHQTALPSLWRVPSRTGRFSHHVALGGRASCSCEDHRNRGVACAHIWAVDLLLVQRRLRALGMV